MRRMRNIVVGYDGFETGQPLPAIAVALAQEHGAALHVVHVAPPPPRQGWRTQQVSTQELQAALVETRERRLEEIVESARKRGARVRCSLRTGRPHVELIRAVRDARADLLVVVDRPSRSADGRGFGTVTTRLLRECPCPVLAKRSVRKYRHKRILAAVEVDPEVRGEHPCQEVVDLATRLAQHGGGKVLLFHAWSLWGETMLQRQQGIESPELRSLLEEARAPRAAALDELAARVRAAGVEVDVVLEKGDARSVIPEVVASRRIDLVVMGTVGRSGLPGIIIGNTAERLLGQLPCSALAVKPAGFVSPVPED